MPTQQQQRPAGSRPAGKSRSTTGTRLMQINVFWEKNTQFLQKFKKLRYFTEYALFLERPDFSQLPFSFIPLQFLTDEPYLIAGFFNMPAYRRLHKGSRGGESFGYLGEVGFDSIPNYCVFVFIFI